MSCSLWEGVPYTAIACDCGPGLSASINRRGLISSFPQFYEINFLSRPCLQGETSAKVPLVVILRERSDRRISKPRGNTRSFAALRMTTMAFRRAVMTSNGCCSLSGRSLRSVLSFRVLIIPSCGQKSNNVILSEAKNLDSSLRFAPFRMTARNSTCLNATRYKSFPCHDLSPLV